MELSLHAGLAGMYATGSLMLMRLQGTYPHATGVQPGLVLLHELQVGGGGRIQREARLRQQNEIAVQRVLQRLPHQVARHLHQLMRAPRHLRGKQVTSVQGWWYKC